MNIPHRLYEKGNAEIQRYREKGQTAKADSVRRALGDRIYQYHREYPDTETGKGVVQPGFFLWAEAGETDRIHEALPQLNLGRNYGGWGQLINTILNGHMFAAQRSGDDTERARQEGRRKLVPLLHELNEQELSDPRARSEVLRQLGKHYWSEGNLARAKSYFKDMVRVQADSFHVADAKGALYEINNLSVGLPAPAFAAETIGGDTVELSDLEGSVVLLKFWATWCAPCIPEIPHLKELQDKYGEKNFQLVGVSLDEDLSKLKQFVKERKMTWPQIQQEKGEDGPVAELYNVTGVPDSYLIDRSGKIVAKGVDAEKLDEAVGELLAGHQK